jgi:hypothetical protein
MVPTIIIENTAILIIFISTRQSPNIIPTTAATEKTMPKYFFCFLVILKFEKGFNRKEKQEN